MINVSAVELKNILESTINQFTNKNQDTALGGIERLLRENANKDVSPAIAAENIQIEKAMNSQTDALRYIERLTHKSYSSAEAFRQQSSIAASMVTQAINSANSIEELDKLTSVVSKSFAGSDSDYLKALSGSINTLEDVIHLQRRLSEGSIQEFVELQEAYTAGTITTIEFTRSIGNLGFSVDDMGKSVIVLRKETDELGKTFAVASKTFEKQTQSLLQRFGGALKVLAPVGLMGKEMYNTAAAAAKFGGTISPMADSLKALRMGIIPEEMFALQAEHKQSIMSTSGGYELFTETILNTNNELIAFTGNVGVATTMSAAMITSHKNLGGSYDTQAAFLKTQTDTFRKLNRVFSITGEQFTEMNTQLLQSSSIRHNMFKLNIRERAAHFQSLQNTYEKLRMDGLLHTQAMRVIETFSEMGAKSPKERMKEAAKMQAAMGALGMGQLGAEAAKLRRRGLRQEGDTERMSEITKQVQSVVSDRMTKGLASEMGTHALLEKTGTLDIFGGGSEMANLTLQQGQKIDEMTAQSVVNTNMMTQAFPNISKDTITGMIQLHDGISNLYRTPLLGAMIGVVGAVSTIKALMIASNMMGKGRMLSMKNMGKDVKGIGGKVGKFALASLALYAVEDGVRALITGQSATHNVMTKLIGEDASAIISDSLGVIVDSANLIPDAIKSVVTADSTAVTKTWERLTTSLDRLGDEMFNVGNTTKASVAETKKVAEETKKGTEAVKEQTKSQQEIADKGSKKGFKVIVPRRAASSP